MNHKLRYLDLFAGIGGFSLGFDNAGMQCVGQIEIDNYCQSVLANHWPNVKRLGDIRDVKGDEFGPIDVICGGFPCQPHSYAGKRRGADDDRNLWPEMRRLIEAIRPTWVVAENVLGIRKTILDTSLSDLEALDYTTGAITVPACAFGAPHSRERLFILAHINSIRRHSWPKLQQAASQEIGERRSDNRRHPNRNRAITLTNSSRTRPLKGLGPQWFSTEPKLVRVANGVPNRVDRTKGLGNSIVPIVAEWLGNFIVLIEEQYGR